jgi:hypothetical protein
VIVCALQNCKLASAGITGNGGVAGRVGWSVVSAIV